MAEVTFILGGARSGKSSLAERLARRHGTALYIATAQAGDDGEMKARIEHHQQSRDEGWITLEEPLAIAPLIAQATQPVLVDCLTLWLSNIMLRNDDVSSWRDSLLQALSEATQPIFLVANEVGLSIVPDNVLARAFRDQAGWLNQAVAAQADHVIFTAAGLPLVLKGNPVLN